jgi:para-nitrobenzyl esterase
MRYHLPTMLVTALLGCVLSVPGRGEAVTPLLQAGTTVYSGALSEDSEVAAFLGIPFAQPPVAGLRWREPRPPETASGAAEAKAFAPACMQGDHIVNWYRDVAGSFGADPAVIEAPRFSEDCLYLNIWKPVLAEGAALPVLVFIHGGSNKGGWSYEPNYNGENLARRGVVVVTVAYRLGVFGFFAHPELPQSNFGLLDQIAALEWLREHIAAAGGVPDNITVMGESAGANDITHLLVSPLAQGLFRRVIHQSAGWAVLGRTTRDAHMARGVQLQAELTGTTANIDRLRQLPPEQILAAADKIYAGHFFDPVIDGHSLTAPVAAVLADRKLPPVDLLIGSNADEWLMYLDGEQSAQAWMKENLTPSQIDALAPIIKSGAEDLRALDRLITANQFVCPSMSLARSVTDRGGRSWFYYFARQRDGERAAAMGAYHGAELPYVFNTHDEWLPTSSVDRQLTETVMDYWVNFARSGDPNGDSLPAWPQFRRGEAPVLRLDQRVGVETHVSLPLCNILMP